uniref:Uncharacterized protein n=1 Tax=Yoonia rhodophyticola TaxID=3137370 RepID=A0AAN0MA86_9RHOB
MAQNCVRYNYDAPLDLLLNEKRNEVGRGSLSQSGLGTQIELELDVSRRSFIAKHGVDTTAPDLCQAADAEALEGSALGAMLVPV